MGPHPQSITVHPGPTPTRWRPPRVFREGLREAQQPPQVVVAAVQDVTPDLVHGRIRHARPLCLVGVSSRTPGSWNVPDVDS